MFATSQRTREITPLIAKLLRAPVLLTRPTISNAMKALVLDAEHRSATVQDVLRPTPAARELLVRVGAISLNPIDPLYVAHPLGSSGRTIGSDFAGTVIELGSEVPRTTSLLVGERVAGFLQGACSVNERPGAFAEYLVVPWDLVWKVPDCISVEQAAGVSLVALTAAQAIWYRLGLETPFAYNRELVLEKHSDRSRDPSTPSTLDIFIYGASTSVALYAAQMVRLTACAKVGGTRIRLSGAASKARWDFLKAEPYGYDALFDYRDQDWPEQTRKMTGDTGIHYAFDCISEGDSVQRTCSTLASNGKIAIVRSREGAAWKAEKLTIEPIYGAVWEGLGEEVQYQGFTVQRSPAARGFAVAFFKWMSDAMGSDLMPNPIRTMPGGLEKVVQDGFQLLGAGSMEERQIKRTEAWMRPVSAEKLVYNV
jgi:NADPH:quinone reductase-like Zn-dependent oxidoreductase